MKRREFLVSSVVGTVGAGVAGAPPAAAMAEPGRGPPSPVAPPRRKILIAGGSFGTAFIRYMAAAHRQAAAQAALPAHRVGRFADGIISWYRNCAPLNVEPSGQESFIASTRQTRSWDEVLLSVDGIVCSGGNTLNQQAIWKAQGIDVVLRQAWDRGIVLGGASAGSLCWFEEGTTDSRPEGAVDRPVPRLSEGQPLPALRRRAGPPAALSEIDRLGPDEARLRMR